MREVPTYRVVATRHGGFRAVLAKGLTEIVAEGIASEMRELGYEHHFAVEPDTWPDASSDANPDSD